MKLSKKNLEQEKKDTLDYQIIKGFINVELDFYNFKLISGLVKLGILDMEDAHNGYRERQYIARQECIEKKIIPSTEHEFISVYNEWLNFYTDFHKNDGEKR